MPLSKNFYGSNRAVPLDDERGWGNTVSGILADGIDGLDGLSLLLSSGVVLLKLESTDTVLAAAATLTVTHPIHRVSGSGGPVTLNGTTAIADGTTPDQYLILQGTSDTNTVTINDGANTKFNGPVILADGESIILVWDNTNSVWREVSRSN